MRINKDSLAARAKNISAEKGVSPTVVYVRFFFDAFLKRLALSSYRDTFVLKGGLYLSSVLGISNRSTIDIDFLATNFSLEESGLLKAFQQLCMMNIGDNVTFECLQMSPIRIEDSYGGFQVELLGRLENIKQQFGIDIATGDPITPSEIIYGYHCLVTGETISLQAYSLETVIAEKLETFLIRGTANSRSKDFYDLYILHQMQRDCISLNILKKAFEQTCHYRHFAISKKEAIRLAEFVRDNSLCQTRWKAYQKKANYSQGISFIDVIDAIIQWIEIALD